ncbi:MAG: hypothetical protein GXY15_11000 [Candidatus Hydrogenedentes bacterium]|nr:hypothetical protein [Candidatus Hydrogenedentota bacterium]
MADDNLFGAEPPEENEKRPADDMGAGNLPPLSDFDSGGGLDESELPPLANFETHDPGAQGGLPPVGDINIETPMPAGGNIKPPPPGFDDVGQVSSFGLGRGGTGFQDLAADSDFSPETPDIGPGPDTSLDTPIFDSAFGPADSTFSFGTPTPAPAQAPETPVFGEADFGVETPAIGAPDAFGGAAPGASTPAPDFGPDTGFGGGMDMGFGGVGAGIGAASTGPSGPSGPVGRSGKSITAKKGGLSPMVVIVTWIIFILGGILARPFLDDYLAFLPASLQSPLKGQIAEREQQIASLNSRIATLQSIPAADGSGVEITEERRIELERLISEKSQQLEQLNGQVESTNGTLSERQSQLSSVEQQIADKNEEFANAQAVYEDLRNETAIIQARQRGLVAEVERLTGYVGELEEANARSIATKDALVHNIDRLLIQVKEAMPLMPQKYDYTMRLGAVQSLRDKAAAAKWVDPALQEEYASFYMREMEIARSNEYFFARLPVTDSLGVTTQKWAECLLRGNWGVYYRTLDGKNIGVYENLGTVDAPKWGFREALPVDAQKAIEATVVANRVPDYQNKVQMLAERQVASENGTPWQRNFDSL